MAVAGWESSLANGPLTPNGHSAAEVSDALANSFGHLPTARLTLTWDQGSEMAHHDRIAQHLTEGVLFAYPGSPWLRGTNENTNGLLRQYFPKGTDLSTHTADNLRSIEQRLNRRPRKRLGWRNPADVFTAGLAT